VRDLRSDILNIRNIEKQIEVLKLFENQTFFWTYANKELIQMIYNEFRNSKLEREDLFNDFYQQIFISEIRHKKGEFYTPSKLVKAMLDDSYNFGAKVLDPACGSGNFIITNIVKILDSKNSPSDKKKAVENIFGFDINPLAVITAKVNILLLYLNSIFIEGFNLPKINIFICDSLFARDCPSLKRFDRNFDLVIGNPPWLTYKDLLDKEYQIKIRELSKSLEIIPLSQYITHIELAAIFFYAIPLNFLKKKGYVFFVMPKSVLNGDHCSKFRSFSLFTINLEIWDFPGNYFFNVEHICLKAEFSGKDSNIPIKNKYPIKTRIYNNELKLHEETFYSSLKIEADGAKLIIPIQELHRFDNLKTSPYKKLFYQGATLVPRTLVFFQIREKKNKILRINSDKDILSRAKVKWFFKFQNKEIEDKFHYKTFLNLQLLPFYLKALKDVFLPIDSQYRFNLNYLLRHPNAYNFYSEVNKFYQNNKKKTSNIVSLHDNLNYWNKLQKQIKNKSFLIVYNASGSNLKAGVINNEDQKIIVGSENYYYSTNFEEEAHYLAALLNSPILSKKIKQIKSSRHIHKRPFLFPIPLYDEENPTHKLLARKGKSCFNVVQELFINNPKITSEKIRIFINRKLIKIDALSKEVIFSKEN
jgi:hypothetical protein